MASLVHSLELMSHTHAEDEAVEIAGVRLTHPDRVFYAEQGLTKREIAEYYVGVAAEILPHVQGRPLSVVRCPRGRGEACFFQKHTTESLPDAVREVMVEEKRQTRGYIAVGDLQGIVALVQMGGLELHCWGATADDLEHPDRLVLDLDPGEGTTWEQVVEAARRVRELLEAVGLTSFVRTTGGKGLHVVAPVCGQVTWDSLKDFSASVARELGDAQPDRYVATASKAERQGKIFVDYLRNTRGATAIATYSTRARAGAPVATPVAWGELTPRLTPDRYTVSNLPRRLAALRRDPWAGFFDVQQSLDGRPLRSFVAARGGRR